MKKIILCVTASMFLVTCCLSALPAFAKEDAVETTKLVNEAVSQKKEWKPLIDRMKNKGLLKENGSGAIKVTAQYVQKVNANLNNQYIVTAKNNTLIITEKRLLARGFFGGGVTKLVFTETGIDFYLNGTLCTLLKTGLNIKAFVSALIPVPVLNTLIEKTIQLSKNLILGKDKGNGVIISIKTFRGIYIPYFITINAQ